MTALSCTARPESDAPLPTCSLADYDFRCAATIPNCLFSARLTCPCLCAQLRSVQGVRDEPTTANPPACPLTPSACFAAFAPAGPCGRQWLTRSCEPPCPCLHTAVQLAVSHQNSLLCAQDVLHRAGPFCARQLRRPHLSRHAARHLALGRRTASAWTARSRSASTACAPPPDRPTASLARPCSPPNSPSDSQVALLGHPEHACVHEL
jgi:hypothetical protein